MRKALAVLVVFLTACGGGSGGGGTNPPAGVTQTMGPSGGSIATTDGRLTLEVPAGALDADTEISIRKLAKADLGPDAADADILDVWELSPDGLQFLQPVVVRRILDQQPMRSDGTAGVDAVFLASESGGLYALAGDQTIEGDLDTNETTLTGTITHFSRLSTIRGDLALEVEGIPDSLLTDQIFQVDVTFRAYDNYPVDPGAKLSDDATQSPLENPGGDIPVPELLAGETAHLERGPYGCSAEGEGRFVISGRVFHEETILAPLPIADPDTEVLHSYDFLVSKRVECRGTPPEQRAFPLSLTDAEIAYLSTGFPWTDEGSTPRPLVTVAGRDAFEFVDTVTGQEVATVETPAGHTYGAVPLMDGGVPHVLAFGEWGAGLWRHGNDRQQAPFAEGVFGDPTLLTTSNVTDATPSRTGGLVLTENGAGRIGFLEPDGDSYTLSNTTIELANAVSAVELDDGSLLAVTDGAPGALWSMADRDSTPTKVADIGSYPRRVRVHGDVAVMSEYGGGLTFGAFRIAHRSGGTWSLSAGDTGPRPVGIDLLPRPGGHLIVAGTSFDENRFWLLDVDGSGAIQSAEPFDLPPGQEAPNHVLWLPGSVPQLLVTCRDSNTLAIVPFPNQE